MIKNLSKENFLFPLLIFLLPVFLITGPFLPDLAVSILAIYCIYFIVKNKKFEVFENKIIQGLLIFWIYLILNSILTKSFQYNYQNVIFYFRFIFFTLAIYFFIKQKELNRYFYRFLFLVLFIIIIDGFIQFFSGKNILGFEMFCVRDCLDNSIKSMRITGLLNKPVIGSFIVKLLPVVFGLFYLLKDKEKNSEYFLFFLMIIAGLLIYASGERTAFFHYLIFFIIFLIYTFLTLKKKLIIFTMFLGSIIFFSLAFPNTKFRMFDFTLMQLGIESNYLLNKKNIFFIKKRNLINESIKNEKKNTGKKFFIFSYHHDSHIFSAIEIFKEAPILGKGVKSFRVQCKNFQITKDSCTTHPHNFLAQVASELGILGLMFYFLLYFYLAKYFISKLFIKIKSNTQLSCLFFSTSILINTLPITPTGNIFNNWLSIFFFLPVGLLIYSNEILKK